MAAPGHKVGNVTAGAMVAVAVVIDILQGLLTLTVLGSVVSLFISLIAGFGFWLWFAILGVSYLSKGAGKKIALSAATFVIELIPFVNAIPAMTVSVLGIIIIERQNEKNEARRHGNPQRTVAAQQRMARMRQARQQREARAREERQAAEDARHG